jgi:peptidoglycan/xylan/chitin deacetylase (PgdA/CDA1 family)
MGLKSALLATLTSRPIADIWRPFVSDCVAVLMLHRFADAERGVSGSSIGELRAVLASLRREGFPLASFRDLMQPDRLPNRSGRPTIVFTVDDGYADFSRIAAPVFAEFDCPATVFLTTGPVDRPSWLWWDRVEYVMENTRRSEVRLDVAGRTASWRWSSPDERRQTSEAIAEALKVVPNADKEAALAALAAMLEVEIPTQPTPRYAAMTWTDVRRCADMGMSFAPHTVNHPMLPQTADAEAEWEILESWRTLRQNLPSAVPVFCYPNGAFTDRDVQILARSDLTCAVTTKPRYAATNLFRDTHGTARFTIPRFAYSENRARLNSVLTGFERINLAIQDGRDGWQAAGA